MAAAMSLCPAIGAPNFHGIMKKCGAMHAFGAMLARGGQAQHGTET